MGRKAGKRWKHMLNGCLPIGEYFLISWLFFFDNLGKSVMFYFLLFLHTMLYCLLVLDKLIIYQSTVKAFNIGRQICTLFCLLFRDVHYSENTCIFLYPNIVFLTESFHCTYFYKFYEQKSCEQKFYVQKLAYNHSSKSARWTTALG